MRGRLRVLCVLAVLGLLVALVPTAIATPIPNVAVSGVVLNASTGVGVPFAHVVVAPDGGGSVVADVMADYRGRFSTTLPPGTYLFTYWIPGGDSHLEQVIVPSAPTADASHTIEGYNTQRVYRFFNMRTGTHFYTASDAEFMDVYGNMAAIFKYDGVAYDVSVSQQQGEVPLYRFFNRQTGGHFYTASEAEFTDVYRNMAGIFKYDGVAYFVRNDGHGLPVIRFYVPSRNSHFYTADTSEITMSGSQLSDYYRYEGPAFWVGLER